MTTAPDIEGRDILHRSDQIMPTTGWSFDQSVTEVFDEMLERSIPDYHGMRNLTTRLAVRYAQPGTAVIDLGCSRGAALAPVVKQLGDANTYVGVEVSAPMREAAIENLGSRVRIVDTDLRHDYPDYRSSVTLSVLTLQFTPIEHRQRIIAEAYDHLLPGGVLLLVEKVLGDDYHLDQTLVDLYYDLKGENGYTAEQIEAKRISLEGVLVPVTAEWNMDLMRRAGFSHIDCYWRHLNFAAWVAVR
jgi:tRNA (cmo5U34)-methyltransferase